MPSRKSRSALTGLGRDMRAARLRRGIAVADLAVRADTSPSSIARLEKGEPGVAIGTLADVLVALGLIDRLRDLVDIRHDDMGLAITEERTPQRGRNSTVVRARFLRQSLAGEASDAEASPESDKDSGGVAF